MKNEKKLSLILMILSAIFVFIIGNFIGVILAIISLIISIKNLKSKEKLNLIALIGDIIIIVVSVFMFIIAFNAVDSTLNTAKNNARKTQEKLIETYCDGYRSQMLNNGEVSDGENILQEDLLIKYGIKIPEECDNYVVANIDAENITNSTFKAYLKCDDYTTDGFDTNKLK